MKLLEVTVESAEFSEEHSYQLSYQGKVETDISAFSTKAVFEHAALYVPFAIVKNGSEYLSATVTVCDDENNPKAIAKESLIIHPGKEKKHLTMEIPSTDDANRDPSIITNITGTVKFSYRIVTLSILDSLKGPNGACGIVMNCHYVNMAPQDLSVCIKDSGKATLGTGKLTAMTPYSYIDLKPAVIKKCYEADNMKFVLSVTSTHGGAHTSDFVLRLDAPNTVILKLVSEENAYALITVLLQEGKCSQTALVHDCHSDLSFVSHGIMHCSLLPNASEHSMDAAAAALGAVNEQAERGVQMMYAHNDGSSHPESTGPDGGVYLLPTHAASAPTSSRSRDGKTVSYVGLLSLQEDVDYEKPLRIRVDALGMVSKSDERWEAVRVGSGVLKETSRELKDNIYRVSFSGEVATNEDVDPLALAKQSSDGHPTTLSISIIQKGNAEFFGPKSIADTVLQPQKSLTPPIKKEDSQPALPPPELSDAVTVPKVKPEEVLSVVTVTNAPGAGVSEDSDSRIRPVKYRNSSDNRGIPRCNKGHPLVEMTGNDLARRCGSNASDIDSSAGSTVVCDLCGKKQLETHVSYHNCNKCHFDICNKCLPERCIANNSGDAVEIVTALLLDELLDDAAVILDDIECSTQFSQVEDAVARVERQLINYYVDTMLNQSIHGHIRFLTAVDDENADMAADDVMEVLAEEIVNSVLFEEPDVRKWVERFAPAPLEPALSGESKRLEVVNEYYAPRLKDYGKAKEYHEVDLETNTIAVHNAKKKLGALTPVSEDDDKSGRSTPLGSVVSAGGNRRHSALGALGLGPGQHNDIVDMIKAELKDKQSIIEKLLNDINKRDDSIVICGLDIRKLREENLLLRKELQNVRDAASTLAKQNAEAEGFVVDLLKLDKRDGTGGSSGEGRGGTAAGGKDSAINTSALQMQSREQLIKITSALSRKIQAVEKEKSNIEQYISESQAVRVQFGQQKTAFQELQEAHMQQGKVLLKTQKESRKLDKYRDTIALQEGVIAKMQEIIEAKLSADPLQFQGLPGIPENMKSPNLTRPPSLMMSPAESAGKFTPLSRIASKQSMPGSALRKQQSQLLSPSASSKELRSMVEQLQAEVTASADENAELRQYAASLEEQLQQLPALGDKSSEEQAEAYQVEVLKADLAVKDIRVAALEARLQKAAQEYAKEISKLRVLLFEFEMNASLDENDEDPERQREALLRADELFRGGQQAAISMVAAPVPGSSRSASRGSPPVVSEGKPKPVSRSSSKTALESIARATSPTTGTTVSVVRSRGGSAGQNRPPSGNGFVAGAGAGGGAGADAGGGGRTTAAAATSNNDPAIANPTDVSIAQISSRPSSKSKAGSGKNFMSDISAPEPTSNPETATTNPPPPVQLKPSSKPVSRTGSARAKPPPGLDPAASELDNAIGDLAKLNLGDLDHTGPALGEEQDLRPPGEREMAGKLNLKQVGNIVSSMAADSQDDSVGFRAAKRLEANDPHEVVKAGDVEPSGAPAVRKLEKS